MDSKYRFRYFNIFGPRQSPEGGYAAVIPLFMESLSKEESKIFGDGEQTRFTYVDNAVEANILALLQKKILSGGPSTLRAEKPQ